MYKKYLIYFVWMQKIIKITFESKKADNKISKIIESIDKKGFIVTINDLNDFEICFKENNIDYKNLKVEIDINKNILKNIYSIYEAYIKTPICANQIISDSNIDEMYVGIQTYGYIYEDDDDFYHFRIISKVCKDKDIKIKTISQRVKFDRTTDTYENEFKLSVLENRHETLKCENSEIMNGGMIQVINLLKNIENIKTIEDVKRTNI